jgi:hypothetical protein
MKNFSITAVMSFLALSVISSVQAVCNDGEVGVGVSQLCGDSPGQFNTLISLLVVLLVSTSIYQHSTNT